MRRERDNRRRQLAGLLLTVACLGTACSGGSSPANTSGPNTSGPNTSGPATSPASTGAASSAATTTAAAAPTTTRPPAAPCPTLKPVTTTQPVLECTSQKLIGAAAVKAGLKPNTDDATAVPGVRSLDYRRLTVLPVASFREVYVFHHTNGDAIYAICQGVVAKTLDPVLGVCTDVGPATRTDRPTVRAWALRAEALIAKSPKALPVLTSGKLMFVACQNRMFPKSADKTNAFEINLIVQHSGLTADLGYCTNG